MLKSIKFIQVASAIVFVSLSAQSLAQNAREVAKKVFPSVALIVMEDENGQPLCLGSGFFVRSNMLVSNFHVVEGAAGGYVKLIDRKKKYPIIGLSAVDQVHDLALISISETSAPSLPVSEVESLVIGDEIYAVGNPQGLEGTFSQGIVSGLRTVRTSKLLQITAPISPGSSGGPVLNQKGEVVGVAVATFKGGQNLNFAIPANYVRDLLLHKIDKPEALLATNNLKKEKSVLEEFGGRSVEGVVGVQFAWDRKNVDDYNPGPDFSTFTLRNLLREPVKNVRYLVVFYDSSEHPLHCIDSKYTEVIPAGLAKRVETGRGVHSSVRKMASTKIEIRILDFQLAE